SPNVGVLAPLTIGVIQNARTRASPTAICSSSSYMPSATTPREKWASEPDTSYGQNASYGHHGRYAPATATQFDFSRYPEIWGNARAISYEDCSSNAIRKTPSRPRIISAL